MQTCRFEIYNNYECYFTEGFLVRDNTILANFLDGKAGSLLVMVDRNIFDLYPELFSELKNYLNFHNIKLDLKPFFVLERGEDSKNDPTLLREAYRVIKSENIDRHSFIMAIGGGAAIDFAGYVAATAHRGIKLIRIPTTVLAQNDAAIGVKNGVNFEGTKNFLGTFCAPDLIINDHLFLNTLTERDYFAGMAEAVKIGLIKDKKFFYWIAEHTSQLRNKEEVAIKYLIERTAALHMDHFSNSGDAFEKGNSRPLDYGHWIAHKIESLSQFQIKHGEAVGIGILLDSLYSYKMGHIDFITFKTIEMILEELHLCEQVEILNFFISDKSLLESSLEEFRTHLGGDLSISLLNDVGSFFNVSNLDLDLYGECIRNVFLKRVSLEVLYSKTAL